MGRDDDGVDKRDLGAPDARKAKRAYRKPKMQEYGSIAKLTQSGGSTRPEPTTMKNTPCL
jgi:hypothetical protein